jgi:predicted amidophosphoribosyltransferase
MRQSTRSRGATRWGQRRLRQVLEDVVAAVFPASCLQCAAALEENPLVGARPQRHWSPLWEGQLRRDFLPGLPVPLRLLCPSCCATLTLAGPAVLQVPGTALSCIAAFEPSPVLFRLIHALKYESCQELAGLLGALVAKAVRQHRGHGAPRVLIPIPLHPNRQRSRGFNQSLLLAEEIGRRLRLPVVPGALRRQRDTAAVAQLEEAQRWDQVAGAFVCGRGLPPPPIELWLVDDVVTSGATIRAAQQAMQASNHELAGVMTICRAHQNRRIP